MPQYSIFFLGATGYIGGSVLARLLAHRNADVFEITVLVRSEDKAKKLQAFGVNAVIGSLGDIELVERLAGDADVLFTIADCDNLEGTKAVLAGAKRRHAQTGSVPILIHTSGTGILISGDAWTKGMGISDKIFDDDDPDELERSIPPTAWHHGVNLAIVEADKEGYLSSYIIAPGLIWGVAQNKLVDTGICNSNSRGAFKLVRAALNRGQAGVVGKGQAIWPSVHVEDLTDFFIILFDAVVSKQAIVGHGRNGYYFGGNGDYLWYDLSEAIGKALVKRGLIEVEEPTTFTSEELIKYFGSEKFGEIFGSNSRARAKHARSLGWNPKFGTEDLLESIESVVDLVIEGMSTST